MLVSRRNCSGRVSTRRLARSPFISSFIGLTLSGEEKDVASDSYFKELLRGMSPQSPDYYHLVALELLMRFLKNPYGSLATVRPSLCP